ncbi:MAG TPA: serine/threonine-protein kinase [Ktedonobacteraceae bacterium]
MHVIGKGGMGTVYIGRDTQLGNRLVAIKEMGQNSRVFPERFEAARNFQQEAHLLAGLQHPNLPSIYDHFEEGQRWYLVMSFIKGQTLIDYLEAQGGRLPVEEVLSIGITLCDVLNYLHSWNPPIIFRDLKPSNIMRTVDGHIYLIDFGIARFFKPGHVVDTTNQGSSGYAPPEQYGTAQTTPRSDIYGLGATLYHLLSGYELAYTPFHFPPLQSLAPKIPPQLIELIAKMMDINEEKRPASAEMAKLELQRIAEEFGSTASLSGLRSLSHAPLEPVKSPEPVRSKKKLLIGLSIPLLIVLVFASSLILWNLIVNKNTNTPYGVVNAFCSAMNSQTPDFLAAYHQFSSNYQHDHSLIDFQRSLLGANQCTISSAPNTANQAVVSMTMACPPPPGSDNPPPLHGPPPPRINPVDLTLIQDGEGDWKIDTIYILGPDCGPPPFP